MNNRLSNLGDYNKARDILFQHGGNWDAVVRTIRSPDIKRNKILSILLVVTNLLWVGGWILDTLKDKKEKSQQKSFDSAKTMLSAAGESLIYISTQIRISSDLKLEKGDIIRLVSVENDYVRISKFSDESITYLIRKETLQEISEYKG